MIRDDLCRHDRDSGARRQWTRRACRRSCCRNSSSSGPARPEHGDYATSLPLRPRARRTREPARDREARSPTRLPLDGRAGSGRGRAARLRQLPPVRALAGGAGRRDRRRRRRRSATSRVGNGQPGAGRVRQRQPHGPAARRQRARRRDRRRRSRRCWQAAGYERRARIPGQRRGHADGDLRRARCSRATSSSSGATSRSRPTATPAST